MVLDASKYEVEDVVTELRNKSLIVSAYNQALHCYVYGIHDLLLSYLKVQVSKSELQAMHRQLITNYLNVSGSFARLPNDNYIYTYIGHHLQLADMFDQFPRLYLNLEFLAAKARAAGCADLLGDLHRYKKFITHNYKSELVHRLEACEEFVHEHGAMLCDRIRLDPVQCGLLGEGEVRRLASEIANGYTERLYITDIARPGVTWDDLPQALELDEDVRAACFAHRAHLVLVGGGDGKVRLWEHSYKSAVRIYGGKGSPITRIEVSPDQGYFLALTENGSVDVWPLEDPANSSSSDECIGPSPRVRQRDWQDLFDGNVDVPNSQSRTFKCAENDRITCASFSRVDDKLLVAGSHRGVVSVWKLSTTERLFEKRVQDMKPITACTLSDKDRLVVFAADNLIYIYDIVDGEYLSHLVDEPGIHQLLVVAGQPERIACLSSCAVTLWQWKLRIRETKGFILQEPKRIDLNHLDNEQYTCAAVTWDGAYLIAGTSNGTLHMWHVDTGQQMRDLSPSGNGALACLDTFLAEEPNSNVVYVLLSGGADRRVRRWHIAPPSIDQEQNGSNGGRLQAYFDVSWRGEIPLIATATIDGRVRVYNSGSLIAEQTCITYQGASMTDIRTPPVTRHISISPDGREIAIATADGHVYALDYRTKKQTSVMKLDSDVSFLKYLDRNDNGPLLVCADVNGCIMVYSTGRSVKLRKQGSQLVTCACLPVSESSDSIESDLITIEKDGAVKCWDPDKGLLKDVLQKDKGDKGVSTAVACFSAGLERLMIARSDGRLSLLDVHRKPLVCESMHELRLDGEPTACCFSANAKLLALGFKSGEVVVWDAQEGIELGRLKEHRAYVRWLRWSPPPGGGAQLVLASAGDRTIAWWDIGQLMENVRPTTRRRSAVRRSRPDPLDINPDLPMLMSDPIWSGKRGPAEHPELMALVPVSGEQVVASPGFTCFVTVDTVGLLHVMNLYRPGNNRLSPT